MVGTRAVLWAQQIADREALAAYRAQLLSGAASDAQPSLPRAKGPTEGMPLDRLRQGFGALSFGQTHQQESSLQDALGVFARMAAEHPDWPEVWFGLGATRLALYERRALSREGPLQPAGMTNAEGGVNALVRALELDPAFVEAARLLGEAPVLDRAEQPASHALAALRGTTGNAGRDPAVLLGRARWESATGQSDSATRTLARYLEMGGDSAVGYYFVARQLFRVAKPDSAVAVYFNGAERATSGTAASLYRQDVSWIASPQELAEYDGLSPADRPAWLRRFWTRRDVAEGHPAGARLTEHYRRYEYALVHYSLRLPSRIGRPVQPFAGPSNLPAQDATTPSQNAIERASFVPEPSWTSVSEVLFGGEVPFREYKPTQAIVDDRGVIYIRHGPPDDMAFFVGGPGTPNNLSWKYVRPDGELFFHFYEMDFDGSAGPTMLVANLPVRMLADRCGFDARLCMLSTMKRVPPEQILRQRDRARDFIRTGTTTDRHPRPFASDLDAQVQVHGMGDDRADAGRLLVVFAVPGQRLIGSGVESASGRTAYRVRVQVMALAERTGKRFDLDTVRAFRSDHELKEGEYLSAVAELAVPPGDYLVSVVLSQEGDARGSGVRRDSVQVPSAVAFALSDIVLGRAQSGLAWNAYGTSVPLNPLPIFQVGTIVELFYTAAGLEVGQTYDVRMSVSRQDNPDKALLTFTFEEDARTPLQVFRRSLNLERLRPGTYLLRLTMRSRQMGVTAERSARLNIVK